MPLAATLNACCRASITCFAIGSVAAFSAALARCRHSSRCLQLSGSSPRSRFGVTNVCPLIRSAHSPSSSVSPLRSRRAASSMSVRVDAASGSTYVL